MNSNGIISFREPFRDYHPIAFPINSDDDYNGYYYYYYSDNLPLIAPFWTDIDISNGGNISYRETMDSALLERVQNQLVSLFPALESFHPSIMFIATWSAVAPYSISYGSGVRKLHSLCDAVYVSNVISYLIRMHAYYAHTCTGKHFPGCNDHGWSHVICNLHIH